MKHLTGNHGGDCPYDLFSNSSISNIQSRHGRFKTGGTPAGAKEMHFDQNGFNWYTPSVFYEDVILAGLSRRLSEIGEEEVRVFPAMTVIPG